MCLITFTLRTVLFRAALYCASTEGDVRGKAVNDHSSYRLSFLMHLQQRSDTRGGRERSYSQTRPSSIWSPTAARGRSSPTAPRFTSRRKTEVYSRICFRLSVGSEGLAVFKVAANSFPHEVDEDRHHGVLISNPSHLVEGMEKTHYSKV